MKIHVKNILTNLNEWHKKVCYRFYFSTHIKTSEISKEDLVNKHARSQGELTDP